MKNKRNLLPFLIILLTGVIYFAVQAQQKNDTHRANFSGEWRSKESITTGGNIGCCYYSGDRMLAKSMKIAGQEKLTFDGKASEINHGRERGKKSTVKLSADGQTMTVNSIVHLMVPTPSHVDVQEQMGRRSFLEDRIR